MRVLLDACVLYPTVLREILTGLAARGLFEPLWSARIIAEWVRATVKLGPGAQVVAQGEALALAVRWSGASVAAGDDAGLWLPDPDDVHVLGAAIRGRADLIVTFNLADFPPRVLAPRGLRALDPDRFLLALLADHPGALAAVVEAVRGEAERLSGQPQPIRALMKRANLPRFGKALEGYASG